MPNWIEGTMKLRGKQKNIKRFFDEGIEASPYFGEKENLEEQVIDESGEDFWEYTFKNEPHVKNTRRMFIKNSFVEMYEEDGICTVPIKQAWSFSARASDEDILIEIADKFQIDIKLYGIECGIQFCQEVLVLHGNEEKQGVIKYNNVIQYEDWEWECPFPNMGG